MTKYKIALSDESPFILRSVKDYLTCFSAQADIICLPVEGDLLIQSLSVNTTDVLITEFSSSGNDLSLDGIEKIKKIIQKFPKLKLIILTSQRNIAILRGIIKYQVAAVISKFDEGEELTSALIHLFAGGKPPWLSSSIRGFLSDAQKTRTKERLTLSEVEVIRKIAQGHSLSDIARSRKRSISTISTQKYNAMRKLLLRSNTDLIKYAFSEKLI